MVECRYPRGCRWGGGRVRPRDDVLAALVLIEGVDGERIVGGGGRADTGVDTQGPADVAKRAAGVDVVYADESDAGPGGFPSFGGGQPVFDDAGGPAGSLEGGGDQPRLAPRVSGRVDVGVRWCGQDAGRDVRDGGVIVVDEPRR